jgi:hypothetical protein
VCSSDLERYLSRVLFEGVPEGSDPEPTLP